MIRIAWLAMIAGLFPFLLHAETMNHVQGLHARQDGGRTILELTSEAAPVFTSFLLPDPDRLILDFPHCRGIENLRVPSITGNLVRDLTVEKLKGADEGLRLVLFLARAADFRMERMKNGLRIVLEPLPGGLELARMEIPEKVSEEIPASPIPPAPPEWPEKEKTSDVSEPPPVPAMDMIPEEKQEVRIAMLETAASEEEKPGEKPHAKTRQEPPPPAPLPPPSATNAEPVEQVQPAEIVENAEPSEHAQPVGIVEKAEAAEKAENTENAEIIRAESPVAAEKNPLPSPSEEGDWRSVPDAEATLSVTETRRQREEMERKERVEEEKGRLLTLKAKEEEERKQREEAERKRLLAERERLLAEKARQEEEKRQREEAERKRLETERERLLVEKARQEEEKKQREEAERKRLEAERERLLEEKARQEEERKQREEAERKRLLAERERLLAEKARQEEERKQREEAEHKRLLAERERLLAEKARQEEERKQREEAENAGKETPVLPVRKLSPDTQPPARLNVFGFRSEYPAGRVEIQFERPVEVASEWLNEKEIRFVFRPARITNKINLLPLNTAAFGTVVTAIRPDFSKAAGEVYFRVELRRKAAFKVERNGATVNLFFWPSDSIDEKSP